MNSNLSTIQYFCVLEVYFLKFFSFGAYIKTNRRELITTKTSPKNAELVRFNAYKTNDNNNRA